MGTREPKFVEPYQLTSSNFVTDFTELLFDGYEPTFKTISLGQNFTTSSNVRFPRYGSSEFLLGSQPIFIFQLTTTLSKWRFNINQ